MLRNKIHQIISSRKARGCFVLAIALCSIALLSPSLDVACDEFASGGGGTNDGGRTCSDATPDLDAIYGVKSEKVPIDYLNRPSVQLGFEFIQCVGSCSTGEYAICWRYGENLYGNTGTSYYPTNTGADPVYQPPQMVPTPAMQAQPGYFGQQPPRKKPLKGGVSGSAKRKPSAAKKIPELRGSGTIGGEEIVIRMPKTHPLNRTTTVELHPELAKKQPAMLSQAIGYRSAAKSFHVTSVVRIDGASFLVNGDAGLDLEMK